MDRSGDQANIKTFRQQSAAISMQTPGLGLKEEQMQDELKREVIVNVIPFNDISPFDPNLELWIFMRHH